MELAWAITKYKCDREGNVGWIPGGRDDDSQCHHDREWGDEIFKSCHYSDLCTKRGAKCKFRWAKNKGHYTDRLLLLFGARLPPPTPARNDHEKDRLSGQKKCFSAWPTAATGFDSVNKLRYIWINKYRNYLFITLQFKIKVNRPNRISIIMLIAIAGDLFSASRSTRQLCRWKSFGYIKSVRSHFDGCKSA